MRITAAAALAAALLAPGYGLAGEPATLLGDAQPMGKGTVRSYLAVGGDGAPKALGVLFDDRSFDGLPPLRNTTSRCFDGNGNGRIDDSSECEGDKEFRLLLPREAAGRRDIPFRWIGVNWNPEGHPPEVWSVPHFDVHFYIASMNEIALIRVGACKFFIDCDDQKRALKPVPAKYVGEGHVDVGATVALMGNHLIDSRSPEFADPPKPFTHSWVFGANDGRVIFYEPMITMAFLQTRPDVCTPIRQPKAWEKAGYYPTAYCIRHLGEGKGYSVSLEGLVYREAS